MASLGCSAVVTPKPETSMRMSQPGLLCSELCTLSSSSKQTNPKNTHTYTHTHFHPHRQATPNSAGGRKSMNQIQATGGGTVTDEVKHDGNCSSRTFYIDHMARSSCKNFPQRIFKILMHRPSEKDVNKIFSRFSRKDPYEIIKDLWGIAP